MSQVCCSQSPCPCGRPLLTHALTGDTQTLKGRSGSVSVGPLGPGAHKVLFEPSEHLWQLLGLILNVVLPLLPSCWIFSFALGHGVSFFGRIQHSPVNGFSAASWKAKKMVPYAYQWAAQNIDENLYHKVWSAIRYSSVIRIKPP